MSPSTLRGFAAVLLFTAIASSGYAQGLASPGSHDATPAADPIRIAIRTLPPILAQRLKRELRTDDLPTSKFANSKSPPVNVSANIADYDPSSPTQRGSAIRARRAWSAVHSDASMTQRFFITDLGTLGGTESFAYAVNDKAQVVGSSRLAGDTSTHAFLYLDGSMIDLAPLNSGNLTTVGPTGINNSGQIVSGVIVGGVYSPAIFDSRSGELTLLGSLGGVTGNPPFSGVATAVSNLGDTVGYSYINASNRHAFLHFNGSMTDIDSVGGDSAAFDVNDRGTIVGFSSNTFGTQAFVYTDGVMTSIDPLGFNGESYARGVNNLNDVVGQFLIQDRTAHHAFLYKEGIFYDIGYPASPETVAFAINDHGQVVGITLVPYQDKCLDPRGGGYVVCTRYTQHAFLYQAGRRADLNTLIPADSGWELAWAFDINSHGQIVGYGLVDGKFRAFLLTPANSGEQCKKGAWKKFGFKNQGQCVQFANTGK